VRDFDQANVLDLLDFRDEELQRELPNLRLDAVVAELHIVDDRGNLWQGARAINQILRRQPGISGALAWLWYFPGFAWLAKRHYRRMARLLRDQSQCHAT